MLSRSGSWVIVVFEGQFGSEYPGVVLGLHLNIGALQHIRRGGWAPERDGAVGLLRDCVYFPAAPFGTSEIEGLAHFCGRALKRMRRGRIGTGTVSSKPSSPACARSGRDGQRGK